MASFKPDEAKQKAVSLDFNPYEVLQVLQRSVEESAMGTSQGGRRRNRDAAALLIEFYLGQVRSSTTRLESSTVLLSTWTQKSSTWSTYSCLPG